MNQADDSRALWLGRYVLWLWEGGWLARLRRRELVALIVLAARTSGVPMQIKFEEFTARTDLDWFTAYRAIKALRSAGLVQAQADRKPIAYRVLPPPDISNRVQVPAA